MPKKQVGRQLSHSQNFLKNKKYVESLVGCSSINLDDVVVEIGPGRGIITKALAGRAKEVIAVEKDPQLAGSLKDDFKNASNVSVVEEDFLKWDLPKGDYKVFSNIPFNLTADIVRKLLLSDAFPQDAYLILQDKAAGRFIGKPIGENTQLSIFLQPFYEMSIEKKISRRQFTPVPRVNVVLARFKRKEKAEVAPKNQKLFWDFVAYGYNQWKPTVMDAFEEIFSAKQRLILEKEFVLEGKKPKSLSIDQWIGLFDAFEDFTSNEKKDIISGFLKNLEKTHNRMEKQHRTR